MIDDFKAQFLNRLAQLLDIRGVAERERTAWLRNLLDIDLSSAGRKFKGVIAFNIEEVARVAKAMNCSTDYLFGLSEDLSSSDRLPGYSFHGFGLQTTLVCDRLPENDVIAVPAKMLNAPGDSEFVVWLSKEPNWHSTHIAAWKDPDGSTWWIGPVKDVPSDTARHCVYAYLALGPGIGPYRIAVLDDRAETAEVMQGFLEAAGYIADTFIRTEDLRRAMEHSRFDAYVLDWSMGRGETTEPLMQDIRRKCGPATPIILMTGEASESEIERAIDQLGVRYFQKTGLFKPIVAQLKKDLREQA
ncbi:helix-turn-helix domain-containing protein [Chromobacterium haemolyticum]|uniref:helix-turn-helix domain-containing protein n=1 Tax=Chromobacterium haemolyticum TaxID=394935 RepID=UPI0024467FD8|nr:helix-turn-helix domain-containing protein [Chromobacterium haemolyticum]MDH0342136.1 helix-turn-helix domain-containing protein [Chromobacterium haemolyticum]